MDVRLDQTGASEAATSVVGLCGIRQSVLDRDDLAAHDTNIERLVGRPIGEPSIAYD